MSVISLIVVDPTILDNINVIDIESLIVAILPLTPVTLFSTSAKSSKVNPLVRDLEILFTIPSEIVAVSESTLLVADVSISAILVKSISSDYVGVITAI